MRTLRHFIVLAVCCLAVGVRPVAAADVAVWVYDLPQWTENQWQARSAALPPGTRHVYASVEEGPRFLLDEEFRATHIQRLAGSLREHARIAVHAMLLQDTRWLDDPAGARDRVTRLLQLNRYRPEQAFAGVHVDIEAHGIEAWECGGIPERRNLILKLQSLLTQLSQVMASQEKAAKGRPLLSAALPWWIGPLSADIPDRLYAFKDAGQSTVKSEADLLDATDVDRVDIGSSFGWFIELEGSGEKALAGASVFGKVAYFTTYTPAEATGVCSADSSGNSRLYALDYLTAAAAYNYNPYNDPAPGPGVDDDDAVKDRTDRSTDIGSGIASGIVTSVGPDGFSALIGSGGAIVKPEVKQSGSSIPLYWREVH